MTTKVNNTVSHKTSQGDVIVAPGKLVLIHPVLPQGLGVVVNTKHYSPIVISETEKIEVGDKYLTTDGKIATAGQQYDPKEWRVFKILALPEHFTPKQLQAIVNGKLKDGDEVYVECERKHFIGGAADCGSIDLYDGSYNYHTIKLNSDKHITLHKVEQKMYTKEEVKKLIYSFSTKVFSEKFEIEDVNQWIKDNL